MFTGFFLAWVVVPFLIAAAMPDRRWLAGFVAVAAAVLLLLAVEAARADGPMGWVGFVIIPLCFIGAAAGAATRGLTLWMRSRGRPAAAVLGTTATGLAAVVLGYFVLVEWMPRWDERPAEEACLAREFVVTVAGAPYRTPAAPVVRIETGVGEKGYGFGRASFARRTCKASANGTKPLTATSLWLNFVEFGRYVGQSDEEEAFCRSPAARGWAGELCRAPKERLPPDWPDTLVVALPDDYEFERRFALNGPAHEEFAREAAKPGAVLTPAGAFNRLRSSTGPELWIATDGWRTPDGAPFLMSCSSTTCDVMFPVESGAYAGYSFSTEPGQAAARARAVHPQALALLARIRAPQARADG